MRILLLNDTTNNLHLGCLSVGNALRLYFHNRPDCQFFPIFNRQLKTHGRQIEFNGLQSTWLREILTWADIVIINGEGTLHDGRALEIEAAINYAAEARKPYFVVNSILEDYPRIAPLLKSASGVSLRDEESLHEATAHGITAVRCVDAALYAAFETFIRPQKRSGIAYTDWHGQAPGITSREMSQQIASASGRFFPFICPGAVAEWPGVINRLALFSGVVSGRYHASLFAVLAGTPLTMLPSNLRKIESLARELHMTSDHGDGRGNLRFTLNGDALLAAQNQLWDYRSKKELHPLHVLEASNKIYAGSPTVVAAPEVERCPGKDAEPVEQARHIADYFGRSKFPLRRAERLEFMASIVDVSAPALHQAALFLIQEGNPEPNTYLIDALVKRECEDIAFDIGLKSYRSAPQSQQLLLALAWLLQVKGQYCVAVEFYRKADGLQPLTGIFASRAVRCAGHAKEHGLQLSLLRRGIEEAPARRIVGAARAANSARDSESAIHLAEMALSKGQLNDLRPYSVVGDILAANGRLKQGFQVMGEALRQHDETLELLELGLDRRSSHQVFYFPERIGVGSVVQGMTLLASLLQKLTLPVSFVIDKRLECAAKSLFGSDLLCLGYTEIERLAPYRSITNIFDLISEHIGDNFPYVETLISVDNYKKNEIKRNITSLFGKKKICGLSWYTQNPLTGESRNLSFRRLREFMRSYSDVQFISLQASNQQASLDAEQIGLDNLYVENTIDPIESIDNQLCLIKCLDGVIGIDNSALLFAGALGVRGTVVLSGDQTWLWPNRKSFYKSIAVVDSLEKAQRKDFLG